MSSKPAEPKTRDRILAESLRLFAERGFAGTTVVDIEEAAGLAPGRGGFYRHFKDKETVLHEAVAAEIERVAALLAARTPQESPSTPTDELRAQLDGSIEVLSVLRELLLVVAHDGSRFPELIPELFEGMAEWGVITDADLLQRLVEAGEMPPRDPATTAVILLSATAGYSLTDTFFGGPPGGIDRAAFVAALVELLCGGPR